MSEIAEKIAVDGDSASRMRESTRGGVAGVATSPFLQLTSSQRASFKTEESVLDHVARHQPSPVGLTDSARHDGVVLDGCVNVRNAS